jgi:hypothetical protein
MPHIFSPFNDEKVFVTFSSHAVLFSLFNFIPIFYYDNILSCLNPQALIVHFSVYFAQQPTAYGRFYDNHQWECSSWVEWGIGMLNSLISDLCAKMTGLPPPYRVKEQFWNGWWDRNPKIVEGTDGWNAQLSFIKML